MKKWERSSIVFILVFIGLISLVSAQVDLRQGSEQVIDWVVGFAEPFLQVILGGEDYTGLLLFERFLIFILLLSIVYLSLSNVPVFDDMPVVLWVVSVIIPLFAVRFMSFVWLNTILIQYQVLGIAIAGILPFIIYLFFLHSISESSVVRKIGWIFFIVVYFGLWSTTETESYTQIYFWTMLIALVFLFLDGTMHRFFERQKWKESGKSDIYNRVAQIDKEIVTLERSNLPLHRKNIELKKKRKERERMYKQLGRV